MNYQEATEFATKKSISGSEFHVYLIDPSTIRPPTPTLPQYRVTSELEPEEWLYSCTYINGALRKK